jgi:hypothetical protein
MDLLDLVIGFTDTPFSTAVAVVVLAAVASASSSADHSPTVAAVVVLVVVGAMDGRAAFSDPRRPVSCSFSLRFSLRACDFEYGARDASNPVKCHGIHFVRSDWIASRINRRCECGGSAKQREKGKFVFFLEKREE